MKQLTGIVKSNSMDKTISVEITRFWTHPTYGKKVKRTKRFLAHDDKKAQVGDRVVITESRPISKRVRWIVKQIIK